MIRLSRAQEDKLKVIRIKWTAENLKFTTEVIRSLGIQVSDGYIKDPVQRVKAFPYLGYHNHVMPFCGFTNLPDNSVVFNDVSEFLEFWFKEVV